MIDRWPVATVDRAARDQPGDRLQVDAAILGGGPDATGDRLHALRHYVNFYDHGRHHAAIAGLVPAAAVNNVPEHHS